jgi:hypothetical protein
MTTDKLDLSTSVALVEEQVKSLTCQSTSHLADCKKRLLESVEALNEAINGRKRQTSIVCSFASCRIGQPIGSVKLIDYTRSYLEDDGAERKTVYVHEKYGWICPYCQTAQTITNPDLLELKQYFSEIVTYQDGSPKRTERL